MKKKIQSALSCGRSDLIGIVRMYWIECLLILAGMTLASVIFRYVDGLSLTTWSVEIWDAIASGNLKNYVAISAENARGAPHGGTTGGFFLIMLPWGIWNFPIWLTHRTNPFIFSSPCILWSKTFLIVCAFACGMLCYRITVRLSDDIERGKQAAILFWGSGTLLISIGYSMQDEIIYVLTLLCAVYCVLTEKRGWALVWMAATTTMMPLMLIPCVFLILYHFRTIPMLLLQSVLLFTPQIICSIYFADTSSMLSPDHVPINYMDFVGAFFGHSTINGGASVLSIVGVILFLLCAMCFFNVYEDEERSRFLIYHLSFIMTIMCIFSWMHFYRFFLCIPFLLLSILLISDEQKRTAAIAGFCVFEYGRFFTACLDTNCFASFALSDGAKGVFGVEGDMVVSFQNLIADHIPYWSGNEYLIGTLTCACAVWLLWLSYPKQKQKIECKFPPRAILMIYASAPLLFTCCFCAMLLMRKL